MKRLFALWWLLVFAWPLPALSLQETFDNALWNHHEDLGEQATTDDFIFSVPTGGSLKGVTEPFALQPGFDPDRATSHIIIQPRNSRFFSMQSIEATDLFQMPDALVVITGYRDGVQVVQQIAGPFWDDSLKKGVVASLKGFDRLSKVIIQGDVDPLASSDLFFFIESLQYSLIGNNQPVIVAVNLPAIKQNSDLHISLSDLQVVDSDNNYPSDFSLLVDVGSNYSVDDFTIIPTEGFYGVLTIPLTVSDGLDESDVFNALLTVNKNIQPSILSVAPLFTPRDQSIDVALSDFSVEDTDNKFPDDFTLTLLSGDNYQLSGNQITPDVFYVGELEVLAVVSDGIDSSKPFQFALQVNGNHRPVITSAQSQQGKQAQPIVIEWGQLVVVDPDNQYPDDFELRITTGDNYQVDGTTLTPDPDFSGLLQVELSVFDGADWSNSIQLAWNVVKNIPPKIVSVGPIKIQKDQVLQVGLQQIEVDDPDNLKSSDFSLQILPGDNYQLDNNKLIPKAGFVGQLNVQLVIFDGIDNSEPYSLTITVEDVASGGGSLPLLWLLLGVLWLVLYRILSQIKKCVMVNR
ncbi:hypothetical protein [Pelagibaculum spongiae]|uniref:Cadherin domain-containing protein n=1 Tax=Pelagibaculum spongiae TaxID=2080658 RepID=A0A2V1H4A8_9GAMM|nr:hypothetical protein [Pelagibaculum spongiae]PVZ72058.1 hypothetical protein DC094_03290 [Pelagibaculum spongiae]